MTEQNTPADVTPEDMEHARAYVRDFLDATCAPDRTLAVARVLQALLPPPPRPTLADMTPKERHACRWMQADVDGITGRWLILNPYDEDGDVEVVLESGRKEYFSPERVTPRPDLPRMEWPGTGQKADQ